MKSAVQQGVAPDRAKCVGSEALAWRLALRVGIVVRQQNSNALGRDSHDFLWCVARLVSASLGAAHFARLNL